MPFFIRLFAIAAALAASAVHADVVISSGATQNMSCSAGVCAPTAASAVLNVSDLETLLAAGNVEVTTTGSSLQAGNITLDAKLSWSSANTLELDAYRSIAVQKLVLVTGSGGLTIITNDGGSEGTFSFGPKDQVTFQNLASPLVIDGLSFTLVGTLPDLASAVDANLSGAFALANDYDASQDGTYSQSPIPQTLEGVIEGLGNSISNLSVNDQDQNFNATAMVESVDTPAVIENLRLTGVSVQDSGKDADMAGLVAINDGYLFGDSVMGNVTGISETSIAAGLAAFSDGTVISSSTNVDATGGGDGGAAGLININGGAVELSSAAGKIEGGVAGGLVGLNEGTISQSFATAIVQGGFAGGLVSTNQNEAEQATIENSYATGNVGVGDAVGGLVYNAGGAGISRSYATGSVGHDDGGFLCSLGTNVVSDYWDTTTSHTTDGVCGGNLPNITGLTTKQLRRRLPAGFDKKIWAQDKKNNNGFPYLIANPPRN